MTSSIDRARHWIDAAGARLDRQTLEPVTAADARRIESLIDRIASARVVALGELDHFIAEKNAFRLWWLERFARRLPLVLAEELGHSDGRRVARYLESGDESWLDRVPTFGWRGDARADREDRPTGVLANAIDRYPTARFKTAQCAFYRRLRALGLERFHGIDVNAIAVSGYADIAEEMRRLPSALVDPLAAGLRAVPDETALEEADRLAQLRSRLADDPRLGAVAADLAHMEQSLRYESLAHPAADYESLRPAMARREDLMKHAVGRILDDLARDEKLVLMAHALHLVKDDDRITGAQGSVGPGGDVVASLGHHLARERGEAVFAVWFLFGGGSDCQPFPDLPTTLHYPPDTLNAALLAHGEPLVLDTALCDDAITTRARVGHLYNLVADVDLCAQVDAVFFLPHVGPLPDGRSPA